MLAPSVGFCWTKGLEPGHGHSGWGTAFELLLLLQFLLYTGPASDINQAVLVDIVH